MVCFKWLTLWLCLCHQKNTPEWDHMAFSDLRPMIYFSLDLCFFVLLLLSSRVSVPSSRGGRWFKWRFAAEPSNCTWCLLTVTFFKCQLHLSQALPLCNILYFPSLFTFLAIRAGLKSLFCRLGNWGSDFKWLSPRSHRLVKCNIKTRIKFLSPNPGLFLVCSAVSFILGFWMVMPEARCSMGTWIMLLSGTDSSGKQDILKEAIEIPRPPLNQGMVQVTDECISAFTL